MPVEIFMRQGVWASISKESVMVRSNGLLLLGLVPHLASKLFASFISSCEVLLLSWHSYTGVGPLTTSIKYHQRSGMRCLNFIEVSVIRRLD
jgi:hypothetical protein